MRFAAAEAILTSIEEFQYFAHLLAKLGIRRTTQKLLPYQAELNGELPFST